MSSSFLFSPFFKLLILFIYFCRTMFSWCFFFYSLGHFYLCICSSHHRCSRVRLLLFFCFFLGGELIIVYFSNLHIFLNFLPVSWLLIYMHHFFPVLFAFQRNKTFHKHEVILLMSLSFFPILPLRSHFFNFNRHILFSKLPSPLQTSHTCV